MTLEALRNELSSYGKKLVEAGLVTGAGGNTSARLGNVVLLSPSGFSLSECAPEDFIEVDIDSGEVINGCRRPTSEFLLHLKCYRRRPDISAIVHCHPKYTVALSSSGFDIKPMYADFYIFAGRNVPHIDYITVTTPELAEAVEKVADQSNVVILRNHGAVTFGNNLKQAFFRMLTVEEGANIQYISQTVGKPRFLSEDDMNALDNLGSEGYRSKLVGGEIK